MKFLIKDSEQLIIERKRIT